ncbi:MAG: hypothetical protein M1839_006514 [Geoglossum umbratile]|nr:MAG: hypothetical protein M1839_006514 [Geoglossum umbratile]
MVGDLVAAANLAWQLHQECYKVIQDCPQDIKDLSRDLATIYGVLKHIQEDLESVESVIKSHGERRSQLLQSMVANLQVTLDELHKLVSKYQEIAVQRGWRKNLWDKLKWAGEQKKINRLRQDLAFHIGSFNLIFASMGNGDTPLDQKLFQLTHNQDPNYASGQHPRVSFPEDCYAFDLATWVCKLRIAWVRNNREDSIPYSAVENAHAFLDCLRATERIPVIEQMTDISDRTTFEDTTKAGIELCNSLREWDSKARLEKILKYAKEGYAMLVYDDLRGLMVDWGQAEDEVPVDSVPVPKVRKRRRSGKRGSWKRRNTGNGRDLKTREDSH